MVEMEVSYGYCPEKGYFGIDVIMFSTNIYLDSYQYFFVSVYYNYYHHSQCFY